MGRKIAQQALNRCRAKAQTEYSECSWPTTAHLIDTIRCTVTFDTEERLRDGYVRLLQVGLALPSKSLGFEVLRVWGLVFRNGYVRLLQVRSAGKCKMFTGPVAKFENNFWTLAQAGGAPVAPELLGDVSGYEPDERISIARIKNGFTKTGGYRDIKVNVVFLSVQVSFSKMPVLRHSS